MLRFTRPAAFMIGLTISGQLMKIRAITACRASGVYMFQTSLAPDSDCNFWVLYDGADQESGQGGSMCCIEHLSVFGGG
ncbi:hypothetical protein [Rhodopseudomonas palustris]|uniref:hypothetical protein n=1 Tax=Rhodopseudomonas palustris TaxID=1076 RepID=UPI000D478FE3|nr:hypothetical protein [Rhodopseudomonas palustris]PPQ41907.1 hypothetical protein CKO39_20120 [Rhodopseudomonas palustris]